MPSFPLVPFSPGVPSVFRNASNSSVLPVPAVPDDAAAVVVAAASFGPNAWGVFTSGGKNVLNPTSVVSLEDFMHEFRVSDFPVQLGSFGSYNKVATPFEGRFIFNKGGSLADRSAFLNTLETIVQDTNLYVLSTPEITYPNVNLESYRLRRRADQGFQLISVEVHLVEIRVAAAPAFSNTSDPTAQAPSTTGAVQPVAPTGAQTSQAQGAISTQGVGTLVPGAPAGS